MQALRDVPDEKADVCEEEYNLDCAEDGPQRVDHAEGGGEEGGDDGDALCAGGDDVDLADGVGVVAGGEVFEPEGHLAVGVG